MKLILIIIFSAYTIFWGDSNAPVYKVTTTNKSDTLIKLFLTNDIQQLTELTKKIMVGLQIKMRTNIRLDDSLRYVVKKQASSYVAYFHSPLQVPIDGDLNLRFYKSPVIYIDPEFDSVIKVGLKEGQFPYLLGLSTIVHELTHYLQLTPLPQLSFDTTLYTIESRRKYINKPPEFEAHAVGYYYLLYYARRRILENIMMQNIPVEKKMKLIINTADTLVNRGTQHVFPEEIL